MKMSYQNIMNIPLFNFGDIKKSEVLIKNTWNEFRVALANKTFRYNEVDVALTTTFLKVFDDLVTNCSVSMERSLNIFQTEGYLVRGTKLKTLEPVSYNRFLPKAEFINEDNRFSPVGVEWLYLAWAIDKNLAEKCTINECRALKGNRFGICSFEINSANKDEKIIDLTLADEMTYENINTQLENSGKGYLLRRYEQSMKVGRAVAFTENEKNDIKAEISIWVLHTYLKLLSEQIFTPLTDTDDKELMYAPFQCIAQYFLSKGYAGIKYKSSVCTGAKDIVLFDKSMAVPVGTIKDFII